MESGLHITLASERLFSVWGMPITNTIVTMWLVMAALLIAAFFIGRNLTLIPGKVQSAVEMAYEYVYGYMHGTLGSDKLVRRYFPLIATIFLFVLAANLMEILPVFGTLTVGGGDARVPLLHVLTSDLNTTLTLAIISFFVVEISGILTLGILKYGSKFVNFSGGAIGFIVGLLEIIGNLARLVSLSFRLFGTVFAGETLLLVIGFFAPYFAPVPFMAFELFIGLLQAAIFAILTLAYIKLAIDEPHGSAQAHGSHATSH
ncbi:MAG TPA: F0F1 ATP synthase subunit A [Candidatus Paceibacterota bacterium]|nr:F0F1 ATP synthase subunit A [Candidatus Paceibacterota bacterium]